jgi:RNA polymerase sigma-70 factor (ECF subfamily)
VALAQEAFLAHLAGRLPAQPEGGAVEALRRLHGADLLLACACAHGEPHALRAFEGEVLQRAVSQLAGLAPSCADELRQLLRHRLLVGQGGALPKVADYSGRGPLLAWVSICAVRARRELGAPDARGEGLDALPEALARVLAADDPEQAVLRGDSRQALTRSLEAALACLGERERALLRLHHLHGLSMDQLAAVYGTSRSGVAREVAGARERLRRLTLHELSSRLRLSGPELESLLGMVDSRLELSLHRLMR